LLILVGRSQALVILVGRSQALALGDLLDPGSRFTIRVADAARLLFYYDFVNPGLYLLWIF
jgi:hypothetical protein